MPQKPYETDEKTSIRELPELLAGGRHQNAYLIVISGKAIGKMFKITAPEMVIGRSTEAQIQIEDDGISRKHAKVLRGRDNEIQIVDLQSTNGTYCEGSRVGVHRLKDGERVQIGNSTILKFSYQDDLEEAFQKQLYESATKDGLTGLYNKKFFVERLRAEFSYAVRHSTALTLVMLDVDHFKKINDGHGHPAGDFILSRLAHVLAESIRNEDVLSRYGGEEFSIILRECTAENGFLLAERVRRRVEGATFLYDGTAIPVTLSIGFASLNKGNYIGPDNLVGAADAHLYEAKRAGRNCVAPRL